MSNATAASVGNDSLVRPELEDHRAEAYETEKDDVIEPEPAVLAPAGPVSEAPPEAVATAARTDDHAMPSPPVKTDVELSRLTADDLTRRHAEVAQRMQIVAAKLAGVAEKVSTLQRQRDETQARLDEAIAANERLKRHYEEQLATCQAQNVELASQVHSIEAEMAHLREAFKSLAEDKRAHQTHLETQVARVEKEKADLARELEAARRQIADQDKALARLRADHSRAVQQGEKFKAAYRKLRRSHQRLTLALEQAEKVIAAADDQHRFAHAVSEAFAEIEKSLERLAGA